MTRSFPRVFAFVSVVSLIAMSTIAAACGKSAATEQPLSADLDLRYATTAAIPGDTINVRFVDVTADSRCPTSVQCVWAGEVTARFTVGGKDDVTLTLGASAATAHAIVRGKQMWLVAMKPYPASTGSPVKGDYVATLRFSSAND